jgi:hypothetical protein
VQLERFERIHALGLKLTELTEQRIAEAQQHSLQVLAVRSPRGPLGLELCSNPHFEVRTASVRS